MAVIRTGPRGGWGGPPPGPGVRLLGELAAGERAKVVRVIGPGPIRRRLMDMGLMPGESVEVVRRAPLGDPLQVRVQDCSLSIRRDEAMHIYVQS
jgi:Fe2+ transport system protein FeoA